MEAKTTSLRFFDLLYSSRQTRSPLQRRRAQWMFTRVAQTFGDLVPSVGGGGIFEYLEYLGVVSVVALVHAVPLPVSRID